jgi:hypothetical protein
LFQKQLEVPSNTSATGIQGVYRQRSYDNLQNGKSSFHRSSVKSLHLPPTYATHQSQQLNNKFSMSIQKFTPPTIPTFATNIYHGGYSPSPTQHHIIPTNFKYVSPQSEYDSNSLPRYPYHKNRALPSMNSHQNFQMDYHKRGPIRHPTTPPPLPPIHHMHNDEQGLLPTPTSSTSSADTCSNNEWDPMIASGVSKRNGSSLEHMNQYRVCKKQLQQATQLLHPNLQQQMYIDNYLHHFAVHQSPYRKYLSSSSSSNQQSHQMQNSSPNQNNLHQLYHNPTKRHSNVYEYHFSNFDLNSISEDSKNES